MMKYSLLLVLATILVVSLNVAAQTCETDDQYHFKGFCVTQAESNVKCPGGKARKATLTSPCKSRTDLCCPNSAVIAAKFPLHKDGKSVSSYQYCRTQSLRLEGVCIHGSRAKTECPGFDMFNPDKEKRKWLESAAGEWACPREGERCCTRQLAQQSFPEIFKADWPVAGAPCVHPKTGAAGACVHSSKLPASCPVRANNLGSKVETFKVCNGDLSLTCCLGAQPDAKYAQFVGFAGAAAAAATPAPKVGAAAPEVVVDPVVVCEFVPGGAQGVAGAPRVFLETEVDVETIHVSSDDMQSLLAVSESAAPAVAPPVGAVCHTFSRATIEKAGISVPKSTSDPARQSTEPLFRSNKLSKALNQHIISRRNKRSNARQGNLQAATKQRAGQAARGVRK